MKPELTVDLDIRTQERERLASIDLLFVTRVLQAAAVKMSIQGEVSVSYVDDEEIHALNRTYRGVDRPTDVLSFALLDGEEDFPPVASLPEPLGDIVISIPTAVRQAAEYEHTVAREVAFLLVHGFLHLIGYDHQDEGSEREMFAIQDDVLNQLDIRRG